MNSQSPFSLLLPFTGNFFLSTLQSELNGRVQGCSSVRVSFIRFTSQRQNRGVLDGYVSAPRSCQQPALIPLLVNQADEQSFAKVRILVRLILKMQAHILELGNALLDSSDAVKIQPLNYQIGHVEYLTWTFIISQPFGIREIQSIATVHSSMHVTVQDLCAVNHG